MDFISDVMFVTLTSEEDWANDIIRFAAIILLALQIVVQLVSVYGAISQLRRKFQKKGFAFVKIISDQYDGKCCCHCCLFDFIFKWIAISLYSMFLIFISVMLGLTKLIAIKQVQAWWLHWLILDYKDAFNRTETAHKNEDLIQTIDSLQSMDSMHSRTDSTGSVKSSRKVSSGAGDDEDGGGADGDDDDDDEETGCITCVRKVIGWINDQTPDVMLKLKIEANVYNAYFVSELIVESLPQLVLNVTNAYYNQSWSEFSIVSTAFSATMIFVSVLKFVYFVGFKNLEMREFML